MSEEIPTYNSGGAPPGALEAFKRLPCSQPYSSDDYRPPTPEEVTQLIKLAGWSQRQAALLVGASWSEKGSVTIRRWRTADGPNARAIPYSAWRLFLLFAGVVDIAQDIEKVK